MTVDFYCPAHRLAIELDGGIHRQRADYDEVRTQALEAQGYRVLRFDNEQVERDLDAVLAQIVAACENPLSCEAGEGWPKAGVRASLPEDDKEET